MYEENCKVAAQGLMSGDLQLRQMTVEENIDRKISQLEKEIERLKESKKVLSPLLPMRISDIREAMSY